jgi:hypothetical protein
MQLKQLLSVLLYGGETGYLRMALRRLNRQLTAFETK